MIDEPWSPAPDDAAEPAGLRPALRVLNPGALTTVQDLGRPGFAHLGVPRSGAADRSSLCLANRLVGNPEAAAALETTLQGPRLRMLKPCTLVLTGAPAPAELDGHELTLHEVIRAPAGSTLTVGTAVSGLRTYLAFAGGIAVRPVLGSRASDLLSGLGPPPLRRGDTLTLLPAEGEPPALDAVPRATTTSLIDVPLLLGPREDWLAPEALVALPGTWFTVAASSNRVGVRLEGATLALARRDELRSEAVVPGAVQVPPSGEPIVLLADHPTTGGYPVIGVVPARDLDRLAQLRPGEHVRLLPRRQSA